MLTARWRPLPDLVIIGVKRGGTTSLFRDLERHPAMCPLVPSARRLPLRDNMKGVHYFDSNAQRSSRWYRSHFATNHTLERRRRSIGATFTAEASPYYFFHPHAARRAALTLPPTTRFVVMLRDPVERTVSHWAEQTRNGIETLSLRDALDAEPQRVGDDEQRLLDGSIEVSAAHEHQTYAGQSHYAESLQRWLDVAGPERLIVLFSEDYYRDPFASICTITDALGVGPPSNRDGQHRNAAPRLAELDPDIDARLTATFRDDVESVRTMLGVEPPWPRFADCRR